MFNVSILFQRSIFVLAALSAVILALAEGEFFPNVLTIPLAFVAYSLTVRQNKLHLPNAGANLLALLALIFAGGEWVRGEVTSNLESVMLTRLVSGTHLLIYLMWIVLFQRKTDRHYWWMFALSLLQVAVGSVLTEAGLYGLLLFVYLLGAIWTLSLFTLHAAREELIHPTEPTELSQVSAKSSPFARREPARFNSQLGSILKTSRVIWENHGRSWKQQPIDIRFVVGVCGTAFASLAVALLFFLLVPRVWVGRLPVVQGGTTSGLAMRLTGFSDEVHLGSMGQILESNERVLFVRMFDPDGNEMDVYRYAKSLGYDEPLFRGAALGTYQNGRWIAGRFGTETFDSRFNRKLKGMVRQEYRLTLANTNYLFAVHPVVSCSIHGDRSAGYQHFSAMLLRQSGRRNQPMVEYTIYSTKPKKGQGPPIIRLPKPAPPIGFRGMEMSRRATRHLQRMIAQCSDFPNEEGGLSRLKTLARKVAGYDVKASQRPTNREMALRLESYLRDSGEYGYSLNSSIIDPKADPVEDFLFNRKQGHCEYYAASLALMLRAVDIPSRLVNGFKGGSVNGLTGEFYVEQRHAHAWVEALIGNGWVTLDATPAGPRSESVAGLAPAVNTWEDLVNAFKDMWSTSFVSMDVSKQKEKFYVPIQRGLTAAWDSLGEATEGNTNLPKSIGQFLSSPENWFSWQGAVATAALLSFTVLLVWGIKKLIQLRTAGKSSRSGPQAQEQIRVEFYERFRSLCSSLGLIRGESQTEREFLVNVDETFRLELATAGLQSTPNDLVESFYDVRFGGKEIDGELQRRLDTQLSAMETLTAEIHKRNS